MCAIYLDRKEEKRKEGHDLWQERAAGQCSVMGFILAALAPFCIIPTIPSMLP